MTDSTEPIPSDLLLHTRDARGVHWLTLNDPKSFNTLGESMLLALQEALGAAQREVAAEASCAFWDAMQFMGGELSMVTWAAAQPAMAQSEGAIRGLFRRLEQAIVKELGG